MKTSIPSRDGHADADIRINIRIYRAISDISDICRILWISALMRMAIPNHQLGPSRAMESWRTCSSVQPVSQPPISQPTSTSSTHFHQRLSSFYFPNSTPPQPNFSFPPPLPIPSSLVYQSMAGKCHMERQRPLFLPLPFSCFCSPFFPNCFHPPPSLMPPSSFPTHQPMPDIDLAMRSSPPPLIPTPPTHKPNGNPAMGCNPYHLLSTVSPPRYIKCMTKHPWYLFRSSPFIVGDTSFPAGGDQDTLNGNIMPLDLSTKSQGDNSANCE